MNKRKVLILTVEIGVLCPVFFLLGVFVFFFLFFGVFRFVAASAGLLPNGAGSVSCSGTDRLCVSADNPGSRTGESPPLGLDSAFSATAPEPRADRADNPCLAL